MRWKLPASHDRACKNDKTPVLQSPLKDGFKGKARKVLGEQTARGDARHLTYGKKKEHLNQK